MIEGIISPIPSFVVLIPAGAAAQVQGLDWWYLIPLGFIGAVGRLLGSLVLYFIADKGEDWLFSRGRRIFGFSHEQLENLGKRFSGSGRDLVVLFLLNATPVIPTLWLSLTCGFIKIDLRFFVISTYFGTVVNALFYMSLGYAGVKAVSELRGLDITLKIITGLVVAALIGWFMYYKKRKSR